MAMESNTVASLFEKLKVDDPWVPPKPWESIPSESGSFRLVSKSQSLHCHHISSLSESSLVRLAMNAVQGVESALITVDKLSELFCPDSADRTFHRISNLWTRSSSTLALGNLLKSIGQFGSIVFLLHKFVDYFMHLSPDGNSGLEENSSNNHSESKELPKCNLSLVNQAFAVAVKKVLDGYMSALNTLYASVSMRRTLKNGDGGCLMDIGNAEITLLEVYLHTKGLRTQIEALGNICSICDIALGFSVLSFEGLIDKAKLVFAKFPRGGSLLTFLYLQLKVVDPVHCALSKFLFLQSCEPYCGFIRSWIYEGRISDPYEEFVVEYVENLPADALGSSGISIDFPLNTVKVRDGVTLPCFLEEFLIPLIRAGQQLQIVAKLLELCNNLGTCNTTHEEILPFLGDFPSECPLFAPSLTFQKGNIENMTLARKLYYERLQEKAENILAKFEFRSQQASPHNIQLLYALNPERNLKHYDSMAVDSLILPETDGREKNWAITALDYDESVDESFSSEDFLKSSECASIDSFEEQNESEEMCDSRKGLEPSYLSSLSFSISSSADQLAQKPPLSLLAESFSSEICERKEACQDMETYNEKKDITYGSPPRQLGEPNLFWTDDTECAYGQHDVGLPFGCTSNDHSYVGGGNGVAWLNLTGPQLKVKSKILEIWKTDVSPSSDAISSVNVSLKSASDKNQHSYGSATLPSQSNECSWDSKYDSKFLSSNPILSKCHFFNYYNKAGKRCSTNYREPLSSFDFTSVTDPLKVSEEKLASGPRYRFEAEFPILADMAAGDGANMSGYHTKEGCSDEKLKKKAESSCFHIPSDSKDDNWEDTLYGNILGGSGWETLLACFGKTSGITAKGYRTISAAVFEMPLDYVIKKCLWEQILLQYKYVSKLTIKLLEEGFDLQEHLLALRRYHFMELADWADLFIMSLWHHKWYVAEADKRIPEIQGVLELSLQRSSCEGDPNKERLYVYMKRDHVIPFQTSTSGVHSFDFLGLGYRVDWPVSIILTPGALKIYSDIFSFLIQIKLAVFSLSDIWCSLKDLVQLTKCNHRSELPKLAMHHICLLTETRYQVNHFVSALQQYVQSQLSHVSWFKFLNSLKHKVKDMMDIEAVHVAYLTESLQICFLSDETRPTARIIQSILQIAVNLQSCLVGHSMKVGPSGEDPLCELSQTDVAQVLAIKKMFMKNLNDLYLCYLKTPKHAEFGLSHFWDYLNCNEYYSEIIDKQLGPVCSSLLSLQAIV